MTLRGISTLICLVDDVAAATDWYTELLGAGPFFTRPGPGGRVQYAKFAVGDSGASSPSPTAPRPRPARWPARAA
jgi:catechol 2,3-dioxygenase-like lactoylglutathione lyase family enzyme